MHNGGALKGAGHPSFKHGRYSKYLPARLLDRYEAARDDPNLLAMDDEIGLIDARLGDLIKRADSGESGQIWIAVRSYYRDFDKHRVSGDVKNMQLALDKLEATIERGVADHAIWTEIGQAIDRRARLVDQERKRLDQLEHSMTVDDAMALLRTIDDVLRRNVTDPKTLSNIAGELGQLVTIDAKPLAARSRPRRR